ncbi:MAG: hypothetical protein HFG81_04175 [Dorea sp.]|nr:hypothetical protein [Dorea sp.]
MFDIDADNLERFIKSLPEKNKQKLKNVADGVCKGKICGFSSIELDYGSPINWQLNPLTGGNCNINSKWYQIPDFDADRGDIKVIWEISRFSHFVTLARAYLLTEDEKYYRAFSGQLKAWLEKNPYSYGANYKCGQECALRMLNGLLAYTIFEYKGKVNDRDKENIKKLILRCYRKILSNFFYAYKCIKNNHTISELAGMAVGAWCCKDEKQLCYAFEKLDEVIGEQFTADGGYKQLSFNYERLALQDIEIVLNIEKKVGMKLNESSRSRVLRASEFMYQCQDENGDVANYGSNDGALIFPVTSCGYRDFRPVINTIYALLTGKKLYGEGLHEEELLWFGGTGSDKPQCLKEKGIKRISSSFEEAGLFTIRRKHSWLMVVLNHYRFRPGHMDQLHIDLWINGINVLCDCGTYSYASELSKNFVSNKSHNTAVYDDLQQMNTYGPFMIYNWTRKGKVEHSEKYFYGEMFSKNGYCHKRRIEATTCGYEIIDWVEGEDGKEFEILFHTPCMVNGNDKNLSLTYEGKNICAIEFDAPFQIRKSSRSLYYLKTEEINCIAAKGIICDGKGRIKTRIKGERQDG